MTAPSDAAARAAGGAGEDAAGRADSRRAGDAPSVAVVIPALEEEATVASVVAAAMPHVATGLVDHVLVVDSDSADATARRAEEAGARVVNWRDAGHPAVDGVDPLPGKGEALHRGLAAAVAAGADIVCFLDADVSNTGDDWVPRLVAPLLGTWDDAEPVRLVKGHYRRDLDGDVGGGRVTELTARPLLTALRPELADVRQPLGGEYAARCDSLGRLRFPVDYGVEISLLIQMNDRWGRGCIAEADLGARRHRNRDLADLGPMAHQVLAGALDACGITASDELARRAGVVRPPLFGGAADAGPAVPQEPGEAAR
ncbi:glucosyl-3-phosphoglycerate synthase [Corynebacterium sp. 335C]